MFSLPRQLAQLPRQVAITAFAGVPVHQALQI
jgi:hypothetical protein